jgi:hypothetical protein
MSIQLNFFPARVTFNFTGNKPAISGLGSAEVVGTDDGGDNSPGESLSLSDKTLVEEHDNVSAFKTVNWLAGVGDICNDRSREFGELNTVSHYHGNKRGSEMRRNTKRATSGHAQDSPKSRRSALRRHCDFWDADQDGVIYPWDIFAGFRKLGFNIALCLWAAVTMAICSSYSTQTSFLPHPFFAIYLDNINRNRHGSTTGAYDLDAELDTRRFDAIFEKYGGGRDYLTGRNLYDIWAGQCCANDFFGWFAGGLECESWLIASSTRYTALTSDRDSNVHPALAPRRTDVQKRR